MCTQDPIITQFTQHPEVARHTQLLARSRALESTNRAVVACDIGKHGIVDAGPPTKAVRHPLAQPSAVAQARPADSAIGASTALADLKAWLLPFCDVLPSAAHQAQDGDAQVSCQLDTVRRMVPKQGGDHRLPAAAARVHCNVAAVPTPCSNVSAASLNTVSPPAVCRVASAMQPIMSPCTQPPSAVRGWQVSDKSDEFPSELVPLRKRVKSANAGATREADAAKSQGTPDSPFQDPVDLLKAAAVRVATAEAKRVLGWQELRSFQRRAVEAWAGGRHCFLLSGTGSGKSGCFVLPALVARCWHNMCGGSVAGPPPLALVISPLVALMRDQVRKLRDRGIQAAVCSPQCDEPADRDAWNSALRGSVEVLYVSPEMLVRLAESGDLRRLPRISLVAVDEAHCVSEWGFHFRPEYGQLRCVLSATSGAGYGGRPPPLICVTATCTPDVRDDVLSSLSLKAACTDIVTGTMNRPNIHYATEEFPNSPHMQKRLLELFGCEPPGSTANRARRELPLDRSSPSIASPTVVYAQRKVECDQLARLLDIGGVRAAAFHSSLSVAVKQQVQEAFHRGELQAVVATVAFGMGIDKPDVRRVVHYGMPSSLEHYAQESGRAGRDGKLALCMVLFTVSDRCRREMAILGEAADVDPRLERSLWRLHRAFHYCRNRHRCRRAQLLEYFGEDACNPGDLLGSQLPPHVGTPGFCVLDTSLGTGQGAERCWRCDTCTAPTRANLEDMGAEVQSMLRCAIEAEKRGNGSTRWNLVEAVQRTHKASRLTRESCLRIVDTVVTAGLLEIRCAPSRRSVLYGSTAAGRLHAQVDLDHGGCIMVDLGGARTIRTSIQMPVWAASSSADAPQLPALAPTVDASPRVPVSRQPLPGVEHATDTLAEPQPEVGATQAACIVAYEVAPVEAPEVECLDSVPSLAGPVREDSQPPADPSGTQESVQSLPAAAAGAEAAADPRPVAGDSLLSVQLVLDDSPEVELLHEVGFSAPSRLQAAVEPQTPVVREPVAPVKAVMPLPRGDADATGSRRHGTTASVSVVMVDELVAACALPKAKAKAKAAPPAQPLPRGDASATGSRRQWSTAAMSAASTGAAPALVAPAAVSTTRPPLHSSSHRGPPKLERSSTSSKLMPGAASAPRAQNAQEQGRSRRAPRRTRTYSGAERAAAPPLLAKLMEAADFNSNVTGGTSIFKRLLREACDLEPCPSKRARIAEVEQSFKSNTKGRHGRLLDELIAEWWRGPATLHA